MNRYFRNIRGFGDNTKYVIVGKYGDCYLKTNDGALKPYAFSVDGCIQFVRLGHWEEFDPHAFAPPCESVVDLSEPPL